MLHAVGNAQPVGGDFKDTVVVAYDIVIECA